MLEAGSVYLSVLLVACVLLFFVILMHPTTTQLFFVSRTYSGTASVFSERPMSPEFLAYAAADARYLTR